MKSRALLFVGGTALTTALLFTPASAGQTEKLDFPTLKTMVEGLGYETKIIQENTKLEFKITQGGLDVYIGAEISKSTNYVWLTAFLGKAKAAGDMPAERWSRLLETNGKVQPAQYYITGEARNLFCGLPVDNRHLTPALMKRYVQFVADGVTNHQEAWSGMTQ